MYILPFHFLSNCIILFLDSIRAILFRDENYNKVADLELEFDDKEEKVNMCKAMDNAYKKQKVIGAIKAYQFDNTSDDVIVSKVMRLFNVSKEYVLELLSPEKA